MTEADTLRAIRQAAKRRQRAIRAHREASDELRQLCEAAQAAGVPITRIAAEAGVSRQAVYDFLGQRPS
jgi:hypothetical protein